MRRGPALGERLRVLDLFPKSTEEVSRRDAGSALAVAGFVAVVAVLVLFEAAHFLFPVSDDVVSADVFGRAAPVAVYIDVQFARLACAGINVDAVDHNNEHVHLRKHVDLTPAGDGCRVAGWLLVPRVKGNLHVAPGGVVDAAHDGHSHHVHRLSQEHLQPGRFDVAHTIAQFRFGPSFSGQRNPLEGAALQPSQDLRQVTYTVQIVPELSTSSGGSVYWEGFSYAANVHSRAIDTSQAQFPMPGVFFRFDFSAYVIQHRDRGFSFSQFVARVASLCGSTLVVLKLFFSGVRVVADRAKKTN